MTPTTDYPDYQKAVVGQFHSANLHTEGFKAGARGIASIDVSSYSSLLVNFATTNDATGDMWTFTLTYSDDSGNPIGTETYGHISSLDAPGQENATRLEVPLLASSVQVTIQPTGNGTSQCLITGSDRPPLPRRIRGNGFYGEDLGLSVPSQNINPGIFANFPAGSTSGAVDLRLPAGVAAMLVNLQAYASGVSGTGWFNFWSGALAATPQSVNGIVVPPQPLRLQFNNTDTVARAVAGTLWSGL